MKNQMIRKIVATISFFLEITGVESGMVWEDNLLFKTDTVQSQLLIKRSVISVAGCWIFRKITR